MTGVLYFCNTGSFALTNASTPTFCRPIALSMPEAVSQTRGPGAPAIGSREIPLVTIPPSLFRSTRWANSTPYPKVPAAVMMGLRRRRAPTCTERSTRSEGLTGHREYHGFNVSLFTLYRKRVLTVSAQRGCSRLAQLLQRLAQHPPVVRR